MRIVRLSLATMLACVVALPALAASMEPRFGNTMQGTRPDGTVMKLYYNKDHSFSGEFKPAGSAVTYEARGTWRLDGDQLCVLSDTNPGEAKAPESCATLRGDHVGETWQTTVQGVDGKPVVQTVEIIKGR